MLCVLLWACSGLDALLTAPAKDLQVAAMESHGRHCHPQSPHTSPLLVHPCLPGQVSCPPTPPTRFLWSMRSACVPTCWRSRRLLSAASTAGWAWSLARCAGAAVVSLSNCWHTRAICIAAMAQLPATLPAAAHAEQPSASPDTASPQPAQVRAPPLCVRRAAHPGAVPKVV